MKKKIVARMMLILILISTLHTSFGVAETLAHPTVRICVEMPTQGYITGIPVGEILKVTINVESPPEWKNTVDGIVGWAFTVQVDPEVLEPMRITGVSDGYFIYDFAVEHSLTPGGILYAMEKESGLFRDVAQMILGWPTLGIGTGGNGKLCELWFVSKSQTAYTLIDLYDAWYFSPTGGWPDGGWVSVDIVDDGHYNTPESPPVAVVTAPDEGYDNGEVTFSGLDSYDPEGGLITSYQWDFGDGTGSTEQNPTHIYSLCGTYQVALTVCDDEGQVSDPATHIIRIGTRTTADIVPDTLNVKSKAEWVTCYIEFPESYNVSDVDISTVMLNDTIPVSLLDVPAPEPVPTEIGDYDSDGIPDLMVKFNRTMVSEFILSKGIINGYVTLTITGEVDGTPFEGSDSIRVILPPLWHKNYKR